MVRLLVDEDLPRSLGPALRTAGLEAADVRDVGLRGCSDHEVVNYAVAHRMAVVTGDVGIANLVRRASRSVSRSVSPEGLMGPGRMGCFLSE
jgi:predicted nuclease of predicted toxin-antitoxin system